MPDTNLSPLSNFISKPFPLGAPDMVALQRYVYSGVVLPVTREEYLKSVSIYEAAVKEYLENIDRIVNVYSEIRKHTRNFKDKIFPKTVTLASSLYHYSKDAVVIYSAIEALGEALEKSLTAKSPEASSPEASSSPTNETIKKQTEMIGALVDVQVNAMKEMKEESDKIISELKTFESETTEDEKNIKYEELNLAKKRNDNDANVTKLQEEIERIREVLKTHQDAYDKEGKVGRWCRIPLVGWIAEAVVLSCCPKEVKAAIAIANCDKESAEQTMTSFMLMSTNGEIIVADLGKILQLIGPAIETIQLMKGFFSAICDDLEDVKKRVNRNHSYSVISGYDMKRVKEDWEELGKRANHYRLIAFVRPVDINVLDLEEPEV